MIEIIDKRVSQAMVRFRSMVQFVTNLVVDSDGNASATGADDESIDSTVGYHFGFYSRPLDGARGLVLKVDGRGNTSVVIAFRDKQYELSLEKGEIGLKNAFNATVLLDKNGNVVFNGGTKKVARVDDTAKADTLMAAWMSQIETGINGLAPGAVTPLSSTFGSTSIAKITSGADKVKA